MIKTAIYHRISSVKQLHEATVDMIPHVDKGSVDITVSPSKDSIKFNEEAQEQIVDEYLKRNGLDLVPLGSARLSRKDSK